MFLCTFPRDDLRAAMPMRWLWSLHSSPAYGACTQEMAKLR
eukprot:CAMPEP_0185752144 /NCGR_PEP_ID=MMETSP1174-20130828/10945_1 /TAXON_ID=35687 /ORGANISM="Dictyocha speculum, Strain CCMP1381" /LENGTH=40 /DNA_ID= /DNA_START= /DNA_END= /DNA_ORIENTATION=